MTNLKMESFYLVTIYSLLILTSEASFIADNMSGFTPIIFDNTPPVYGQTNTAKSPTSAVTFTPHQYDPTGEESLIPTVVNLTRLVRNDALPDDLDDGPVVAKKIENVFNDIFKAGENIICYFGAAFHKNEQYYEFEINTSDTVQISIGFGYAWNNVKLKGWTADFDVDSTTSVLLSKNDKEDNIQVELQSGSVKEILTSQKDPQYGPVVCLNGEVDSINVKLFNGMKMDSIPSGTNAVDLPNSGKKLKAILEHPENNGYSQFYMPRPTTAYAVGFAEMHTLTSTTPHTYLFVGVFYDGSKWWLSPNLVDEENNWDSSMTHSKLLLVSSSVSVNMLIHQGSQEGVDVRVFLTNRNWAPYIYDLYDSGESALSVTSTDPGLYWSNKKTIYCSAALVCIDSECYWPRSNRENLRPGLCIKPVCKYMIEAHKRTGVYKPDGVRTIGNETVLKLIAPKDVGVAKKGIAMIKALLDREEDFGDIDPTGEYEFGGLINPPISGRGPQQRYFNDVDLYLDVDKSVCEEKEKFIPIKSSAGITVGFGKYLIVFDYIRCTCHYAVITNLVTNALDPKKWFALEEYARSQYQRLDPNSALDDFESQNSNLPEWPAWPAALPQDVTRKLYYNDPDSVAGFSDLPHLQAFYNRDRYSAATELFLGLSSCFYNCLKYYYVNKDPVFHVTTFVRQRVTKDNSADKKYYTEVHPLMWYHGLKYRNIDFEKRDVKTSKSDRDVEMTLYDDNNIPSWFVNKNGNDPEVVEASYISLPAFLTKDDYPPNPYLTDDSKAAEVVESS